MSKLMLIESPNKVKNIQHYLQELGMGDIKVLASVGHIRDLPKNELGVDTSTFAPTYLVSEDKKAVVSKLKASLQSASEVYLATDPDREGEAIAWHLYATLGIKKLGIPVHRVTFREITKNAIGEGMKSPRNIDMPLVYAQEARRILDRLVGYMVSPRLGGKLSAGRVQSPTLRLIVDREAEIQGFIPITHYDVRANIAEPMAWSANWVHEKYREKGQSLWLDQVVASDIARVKKLKVTSVEKTQRNAKAPAPFTTSSLQQAASKTLKMSPEDTMKIAQRLFSQGAISYHRTDSQNLSADSIKDVIKALTGSGLPHSQTPNKWASKAGAQEAHEAIRPTDLSLKFAGETEQEQVLYELIKQRTLACQMPDAIYHVTTIMLIGDVIVPMDGEQAIFKAQGEVLTDQKGWKALSGKQEDEDEDEKDGGHLQALPPVKEGELLSVTGEVLTKKTTPPPRYSEADMIKKMESLEIGRPSTYATILKNIKDRDYVVINSKRKLEPTEKGKGVVCTLKGARFNFIEYDWTKEIEQRLDEIAIGKGTYIKLVTEIYNLLKKEIDGLPEGEGYRSNKTPVDGMLCQCDGGIEESDKLYQCATCKATVWKVIASRKLSKKEAGVLLLGKSLIDLDGFISKANKAFSANLKMTNEGKVELYFDETDKSANNAITLDDTCQCGSAIAKSSKNWKCLGCGATVWATISDKAVTHEQAIQLLKGESIEMEGLKSKSGKHFNATVLLKDGKTVFEFAER